jgi:hypothetical protein
VQAQRGTVVAGAVLLGLMAFFIWFFFWSRAPILSQ